MINYGTGCIFEYDATHTEGSGVGFKEEDTPNFFGSYYSRTKALVSGVGGGFYDNSFGGLSDSSTESGVLRYQIFGNHWAKKA